MSDVVADVMDDVEERKPSKAPAEETSSSVGGVIAAVADTVPPPSGRFRWTICALLFFAATINYIDRQVIGILKPTLAGEFGWTELDYSWIVFSFQTAYAIGLLFIGKLMDRIGTKIGFAIAIV